MGKLTKDFPLWKPTGEGIRKNLEEIKSDLSGDDYLNMKFPILYHEETNEYAVCFNKSEVSMNEMSKDEIKFYLLFLKGFEDKKSAREFWDRVTLDYTEADDWAKECAKN